MYLTQVLFLNPELIEYSANEIAPLVLGRPRFIFIANARILRAKYIERILLELDRFVVVFGEQLLWTDVPGMHAMEDNTHAFGGGNEGSHAKEEENQC